MQSSAFNPVQPRRGPCNPDGAVQPAMWLDLIHRDTVGETIMAQELAGPGDILACAAGRYGDAAALVTDGRTLTYAELHALCRRAVRRR